MMKWPYIQGELDKLDDEISLALQRFQDIVRQRRPAGYPVDVAFPPWGKLAWSGRRGRWRLVVIDEDECEDLLSMPRLCRSDACMVLPKLAERLGIYKP
jgi:NAD-dependent dihydropyrimidine dehydrogenase PreA subunit